MVVAALSPGATAAAIPVPDEATNGFWRGSSTLTVLPLVNTCSNTRLAVLGRSLTCQDTGIRAVLLVKSERKTAVALDAKLAMVGVTAVTSPIFRVSVFSL